MFLDPGSEKQKHEKHLANTGLSRACGREDTGSERAKGRRREADQRTVPEIGQVMNAFRCNAG